MSSSDYLQSVTDFLGGRGWQTSTTTVRDGVYVIAGQKNSSDGTIRMLTMVVDSPESQTTSDHLKYLLKAGQQKNANKVVLTSTVSITHDAKQAANNHNVQFIDPDTVTGLSGSGLDTDSTDISMPDPESDDTSDGENSGRTILTRRRMVAGSVIVFGGGGILALGGGGSTGPDDYDVEAVKSEATTVSYEELFREIESYEGERIYYSGARIQQVIEANNDTYQFRVFVNQDGITWENDILGRWQGERYLEEDLIDFWGVVNGPVDYETAMGTQRTIPDVDIVDINSLTEPTIGENVVISEDNRVVNEGEFSDEIFVRGTVQNNSPVNLGYVEVSGYLSDSSGSQLHNNFVNTNGVPAGESWDFEVEFFFAEADNVDSYTVELSDITW